MKKSLFYTLAFSVILFMNACGEKKTQEKEMQDKETISSEQSKEETPKNTTKTSSNKSMSKMAKNSTVQLEFRGFIDRKYDAVIDVMAQEMFKNGPMMISITFDSPEDGGGSVAFSAPKFEQGVYEMTGEAMKGASVASDKYLFKSQSGVLTITNISDEFIEGNVANILFKEDSNFDAGELELVSGSFKIPLKKK
jgi:hypothetical protein